MIHTTRVCARDSLEAHLVHGGTLGERGVGIHDVRPDHRVAAGVCGGSTCTMSTDTCHTLKTLSDTQNNVQAEVPATVVEQPRCPGGDMAEDVPGQRWGSWQRMSWHELGEPLREHSSARLTTAHDDPPAVTAAAAAAALGSAPSPATPAGTDTAAPGCGAGAAGCALAPSNSGAAAMSARFCPAGAPLLTAAAEPAPTPARTMTCGWDSCSFVLSCDTCES